MKKIIYLFIALSLPLIGISQNKASITWDGSSSSDWQTAANWSTNTIPTSTDDVTIADVTTQPIIDDGTTVAVCNNLTISSGADLTVASNGRLTVSGTFTNNAGNSGFIIQAGGSVIQSTANVPGTFKMYLSGTQWHYVSAPVSGLTYSDFNTLNFESWDATAEWAGGTNTDPWTSFTGSLTDGVGYANYESTTTKSLTGNLNQGTVDVTIYKSSTGAAQNQGWNLVGNPYTAAVDWTNLDHTTPNLDNAIYFYDGSQYASWVNGSGNNGGTKYIPAGQGFFVHGGTNNATLTFNNDDRVHDSQSFWKGNSDENKNSANHIRLLSGGNGYSDELVIRYVEGATFSFDGEYDAYKLISSNPMVPQFYSLDSAKSTMFSINSLPFFDGEIAIPLGIRVDSSGDYTISASEINIDQRYLLLEDVSLDSITNLRINPVYKYFYPGGGANDNRFILHIIPNSAPICANNIENMETLEDSIFEFTFGDTVFFDADGDQLIYWALQSDGTKSPSWLSFDNATKTFSGTPENKNIGTVHINLFAMDNYYDTTVCAFDIQVNNTNDAPFVDNNISNQVTYVDSAWAFTFADNVFTDDDPADSLIFSATLANDDNLPDWLTFNPETRTFSATPTTAEKIDIKVTATDTSFAEVSTLFSLYVVDILNIQSNLDANINIFPNPTTGLFEISGDYINSVEVIDINGKIIVPATKSTKINISDKEKGIYFIKINTDTNTKIYKIIKI